MRRCFAIVLLFGVLAMNMDIICQQVLCLSGHNVTANGHAHHRKAAPRPKDFRGTHPPHLSPSGGEQGEDGSGVNHGMPKGNMCPAAHNDIHQSLHNMPQTSIRYYPVEDNLNHLASVSFELTLARPALDLRPYLQIISKIQPGNNIFLSIEAIPLEVPPKRLALLESFVFKA